MGVNSGNSRNDGYTRTLHTEYGNLPLKIPRDRNGEFTQQPVSNMTHVMAEPVDAFVNRPLAKRHVYIDINAT